MFILKSMETPMTRMRGVAAGVSKKRAMSPFLAQILSVVAGFALSLVEGLSQQVAPKVFNGAHSGSTLSHGL